MQQQQQSEKSKDIYTHIVYVLRKTLSLVKTRGKESTVFLVTIKSNKNIQIECLVYNIIELIVIG